MNRQTSASESQIENTQERYRLLVEQSTDGILVVDDDWNIEFANQPACRMLGYTRDEIVHRNMEDTYLPEDRALIPRRKQQMRTTGGASYVRLALRKDGSSFFAEVIVRQFKQGGHQAIFRDITERKRVEELLRLQSTALEAAANAIAITDTHGVVLWVNPAFTSLTGYARGEAIGSTLRTLKSGEHDREFYRELWETITAGRVWFGEMVNRRKDGSLYTEEMTITPVRDGNGTISRFIAIKQDITGRKQAEAERARLFEQLEVSRERARRLAQQAISASEEERRRLSRELHDEASQMFTVLKVKLGLLCQELPPEAAALRTQLEELMALTDTTGNQIREVARSLRPPALDTLGLDGGLEELCREFAELSGLAIDYQGVETPPLSEATTTCSYRVVQEALTNVAKHAQAKHVEVRLAVDNGQLRLAVSDDGKGYDATATQNGLGLEGMRERINLLGGRLDIQGEPGKGTRLVAHIPCEVPR